MPTPPLLLRLLQEARGVPILFSAVSSSGQVSLQEVSDALLSLNWTVHESATASIDSNDQCGRENTVDSSSSPADLEDDIAADDTSAVSQEEKEVRSISAG